MQQVTNQSYYFDGFVLDLRRGCLLHGTEEVKLRPKSFATLQYLVENRGRLIGKDELVQAVWPGTAVTDNSLVQCLREVREALGDSSQHFIKTVPRRGYIFEALIEPASQGAATVYTENLEGVRIVIEEQKQNPTDRAVSGTEDGFVLTSPHSGQIRRSKQSLRLAVTAALLIGLVIILAYFSILRSPRRSDSGNSSGKAPNAGLRVKSIAVLPFKSLSKYDGDEYLGLGMADTLITRLSGAHQIIVRPTSAVQRYASANQDSLAAGREQKVDAVLEGSIQRSGEKVRVTVRLINVEDGSPLWAYKYDEYGSDIMAAQDAISDKVADALALNLTGEEKGRLAKRYTDNLEAYNLYLKGVFFRNQLTDEGLKKSIQYFQRAIELDSRYALAYAGEASSYAPRAFLGYIPFKEAEVNSRRLITKALELDDTLAEAHTALGEFRFYVEWDWEGAEKEFKRAIELKPNEHLAHHYYANLLTARGRFEEAIAERNHALEIDPLSPRSGALLAWDYYMIGRYEDAIEQYKKIREIYPTLRLIELGPSYERKGMYEQAIREYLEAEVRAGLRPEQVASLRQAYARSGWNGYWQKRLDIATADAKRQPVQAVLLAQICAHLGKKDQALQFLERAYEDHDMPLVFLNVDPVWEGLRAEPRFQDLLRRIRLMS